MRWLGAEFAENPALFAFSQTAESRDRSIGLRIPGDSIYSSSNWENRGMVIRIAQTWIREIATVGDTGGNFMKKLWLGLIMLCCAVPLVSQAQVVVSVGHRHHHHHRHYRHYGPR
jgi:hypothetical protein